MNPDRDGKPWVDADDLTPGQRTLLYQNWQHANVALDDLLAQARSHRDTCCAKWYCGSEEMAGQLAGYNLASTHMMLRVAMERLIL